MQEVQFYRSINKRQIIIGIFALLIGSMVYLIDRPPDQTYFVYESPASISLYNSIPKLFGIIGNSLPAFLHVFSFILITAGLLCARKIGYVIICLTWFCIDCGFELGQKYSHGIVKVISDWFEGIPFLENTKNYFLHGAFDIVDVAAIAFGSLTAYFVISCTRKGTNIE
jgi:hypothetical protein